MIRTARAAMCAVVMFWSLGGCDAASNERAGPARDAAAVTCASGSPPAAIECSLYYRESNEVMAGEDPDDPKFQFQEQVVRVGPEQDTSATVGQLTLAVAYSVPETDVPSVSISVTASDEIRLVSWLYQLGGAVRNEFAGDHGFTGLVYLTHPTEGGDYQLICKAE